MKKTKKNQMNKLDVLNQVAAFHRTFQHPILSNPQLPTEDRCKLRLALLFEELKELEEAIEKKDIVEVADALCDIQYVLTGAILEFGIGKKFEKLFEEVQRSNMSKVCNTREESEQTITYYKTEKNTDAYHVEKNGKFLVYRKKDNKTLKSINYSPPNLKEILKL